MNGKISVEFFTGSRDAGEDKVMRAVRAAYTVLPMIEKYGTTIEVVKIEFTYQGHDQHNGKPYGGKGPDFVFHCRDNANTQFSCAVGWKSTKSWSHDPTVEEMVKELRIQVSASVEQHLKRAIECLGGKFVKNKAV